jgi:hypothetical protein
MISTWVDNMMMQDSENDFVSHDTDTTVFSKKTIPDMPTFPLMCFWVTNYDVMLATFSPHSTLEIKVVCSSKMLVSAYKTTWFHIHDLEYNHNQH